MEKTNIDFDEAIKVANIDNVILKRRSNNMLLSDYQVSILDRCGIDFNHYSSIKELLFDIEDILNTDYDEELDIVSSQIAEYIYYTESKK